MNSRVAAQPKPASSLGTPLRSYLFQRKCACGGTLGPTGECEDCRKKREGVVHRRAASHTSALSPHSSVVPPVVHEVLRAPGQPLDPDVRAFMEPRFGHDFSDVPVHADADAAESARGVNALAYTVGSHIVFGAGQFTTKTTAGQQLLAHELTHVVQQSSNRHRTVTASLPLSIGPANAAAEQFAQRQATLILEGHGNALPSTAATNR